MAELKPCPFCGRVPIIEDCGERSYFIKCKCGIEQSRLYMQKCDAVRHWNRRKTEPQRLEQFRVDLEQFRVGLEYHTDTTHFGKAKGESITTNKVEDEPQTESEGE